MNDRAIVGEGTAESDWADWLNRQHLPRLAVPELFAKYRRLVVVAPHPDDEILACGGLLALAALANFPVLVVAVTDGEASHGPADHYQRARLGKLRVQERCAGLLQLGIEPACVVRLEISDGTVAQNTAELVTQLDRLLKPGDLVVTTWFEDGHPDHEATAHAVRRTDCQLLQAPVWMWHWATPAGARIPWAKLAAIELSDSVVQAKQNALAKHHSQIASCSSRPEPVLMPSIIKRTARRHEYFFLGDNTV